MGCDQDYVDSLKLGDNITGLGFLDQSLIFESATYLFQPEGYGEGIPFGR